MADITIAKEDVKLINTSVLVTCGELIPHGQMVYLKNEIPRKQRILNIIRWLFRRELITKIAMPIYAHEDIKTPTGIYAGDGKVFLNPVEQLINMRDNTDGR